MMDKNREAFEAWCNVVILSIEIYSKGDRKNHYKSKLTRDCWDAWRASRQAIEVELNGDSYHSNDYFNDGYRIATEAAEEAITSLGIRVKGNEE